MNLNPTQTVLSSMRRHGVRCLLMGGQACVFYGAAEFSRDVDFALVADEENLAQRAVFPISAFPPPRLLRSQPFPIFPGQPPTKDRRVTSDE